jgi:D-serine deaminase-like pyridoxal phosphate-dependent protein
LRSTLSQRSPQRDPVVAAALFSKIETPALLVERRILEDNIARMQEIASETGVELRPHVKTHKSADIAQWQMKAGASGVTTATLTEAEVMAAAGVDDVFIAYPPTGRHRLERLAQLFGRATISVGVADTESVTALSKIGKQLGHDVHYRWEIDSGLGRLGTPPGEVSAHQIESVLDEPRTVFDGLFTHAGHAYRANDDEEIRAIGTAEGQCLVATRELLRDRGVNVRVLSAGSTPTALYASAVAGITEIRPGNYVFNDATQVSLGVAVPENCAQTVLATVVGRPAPDRLVIDAGSKALPPENPSGRSKGWGIVVRDDDLVVDRLFEEHGVVTSRRGASHLRPGDRVRIIPNHACTATNLHERFWLVDGEHIEASLPVDARGWARIGQQG